MTREPERESSRFAAVDKSDKMRSCYDGEREVEEGVRGGGFTDLVTSSCLVQRNKQFLGGRFWFLEGGELSDLLILYRDF